jgi:acyl-CoA reductase-like NAD-dependent aldehyde dehydrogenase
MSSPVIRDGKITGACPVDFRPLPTVAVTSDPDLGAVVKAARAVQPRWEALGLDERARLLKRAGRRMLERRQEVLELLHDEAGKTPAEILMSEALGPLQYISDWIKVVRRYSRPRKLPINPLAFPGKSGRTEVVPRGVVGIIAPWNYPLANFFKPVFAALLTGNTVVLKPSEYSPRTAAWFAEAMGELIPKSVLACVYGDRQIGQALVRAGINAVTFTGSYASGREVVRLAAEEMIPCSCELGGKDAAIVLSDCALDRTVAGILHWGFHNAGQACGDIERVYVENAIAPQFVEQLADAASRLRVHSGDPATSDVGPVVHAAQLAIVEEHVADALARGATLVCGGRRTGTGLWYEPTVLDHCNHTMKVMTEPTFGPVLPIARVSDPEEAATQSNDCGYGLNASIWSTDRERAGALGKRLEVGTVFINNHALTGAMAAAPWTGVKHTGYGIANSAFALAHYTRPRTTVVDRSAAPDPFWFPVDESLEELGHALADAQLGKIGAALKLPFLIRRRTAEVERFAKPGPHDEPVTRLRPSGGGGLRRLLDLDRLAARFKRSVKLPPLTRRELAWGRATMEAIYATAPDPRLPGPVPAGQWDSFIQDMLSSVPPLAGMGLRAGLWVAGFSPIFALRKLATLERVSPEERQRAIQTMSSSDLYLIRQIAILLKTTGGFAQASTTGFQQAAHRPAVRPPPLRAVSEG